MESECASGDQAQLGVHLLHTGVRESVPNGRLDPGTLLGDGARELDERRQARSPRPGEPGVEQRDRVGEPDAVDLAQLLGEQVGAVEPLVELLDAGELELLVLGQVARVLPECEAGSLEFLGELGLALAARVVSDLAADLVERVSRELDEVERVVADAGVRAALADRPGDPRRHVAGHQLDLVAALFPQRRSRNFSTVLRSRPGPAHTSRPLSWSTTTVRYRWPLRIEISSTPMRFSPANRSRVAVASSVTRLQIQPTVRPAIRISCETAVLEAWTASHAT